MSSPLRISLLLLVGALSACGSAPPASDRPAPAPVEPDSTTQSRAARQGATTAPLPDSPTAASGKAGAAPATASAAGSAAPGAAAPGVPPVEVPRRAVADFDRAVGLLRSGRAGDAELEFKQLASGYPQLAGPHINLGLLQRKAGRLEEAEKSLRTAVQVNPASAVAWNELGVTLRMAGKFQDAMSAYESALGADPNFAPVHRNFGVLLDLYLGDPERALTEFERYKELTGEDKPVSGWIAELRQRTGKPAAPRSAPNAPAETPSETPSEAPPADAPPAEPPAEPARAGA
jgi:Flp pilus assembly protein TadD